LQQIKQLLTEKQLHSVIETGARFLLDPRLKHEPTLLSETATDRERRIDFLKYCIDLAAELGSDCVSLWSGKAAGGLSAEASLERLATGLRRVIDYAAPAGVTLAFEPEPGMFIDTTSAFHRLLQWIDSPHLQMTMDIGHLYCQGEFPIADYIQRWRQRIVNVHIEDMRVGVHDHLMFGEGEIDFPPVIKALQRIEYAGGVHVELSRHSHDAPNVARRAYEFLHPLIQPSVS
jgi:sugar phosphate isomerase/epimerase